MGMRRQARQRYSPRRLALDFIERELLAGARRIQCIDAQRMERRLKARLAADAQSIQHQAALGAIALASRAIHPDVLIGACQVICHRRMIAPEPGGSVAARRKRLSDAFAASTDRLMRTWEGMIRTRPTGACSSRR